jgi:hypothetical protein
MNQSQSSRSAVSSRVSIIVDGEFRGPVHQTRRRREDQIPPNARNDHAKRNRPAVPSSVAKESVDIRPTPIEKSHARKMETAAAAFQKRRSENRKKYVQNFPGLVSLRLAFQEANQRLVEEAATVAMSAAVASHPCRCEDEDCLVLVKTRSVAFIGLGYRFGLKVDNLQCKVCRSIVTVHPLEVGAVPTTATENCETWLSTDYCILFRDMQLHNGLSADAYLHATGNYCQVKIAVTMKIFMTK